MIRVMIVEDEPAARERYADYVDRYDQGFRVVALCGSAQEALEQLSPTRPDVLLTDIRMPGRSGLELVACLRSRGWEGFAVIISGYDEFAYAQDAIRSGVFDYLLKPVFPEDMASLLDRIQRAGFDPRHDLERALVPAVEPNRLPEFLGRAVAHIDRYYDAPISLADVASAAGVSPTYLSSAFTRYLGIHFLEFLHRMRVEASLSLLRSNDWTIEEIASHVGFDDASNYFRIFKRMTGMTPGEYRASGSLSGGGGAVAIAP